MSEVQPIIDDLRQETLQIQERSRLLDRCHGLIEAFGKLRAKYINSDPQKYSLVENNYVALISLMSEYLTVVYSPNFIDHDKQDFLADKNAQLAEFESLVKSLNDLTFKHGSL